MACDDRPRREVLEVEIVDQKGDVIEMHEIFDPRPMYIEKINSDPMYADAGLQARLPDERAQFS